MPKGRNNKVNDKLDRIAEEANYEKYREGAREIANRMKIQYDELIEVGFIKEEALQLLMSCPIGGMDEDFVGFVEDDED